MLGQHGGENPLANHRPFIALGARDDGLIARLQADVRLRALSLDGLDHRRNDDTSTEYPVPSSVPGGVQRWY